MGRAIPRERWNELVNGGMEKLQKLTKNYKIRTVYSLSRTKPGCYSYSIGFQDADEWCVLTVNRKTCKVSSTKWSKPRYYDEDEDYDYDRADYDPD